ncbi:MAG: DNA-processing protein DprA, partial [Bifidobacteriaceae bacterium]|nr:DNA-processing protein DprA [Bifidobacteriaceae bacterium]
YLFLERNRLIALYSKATVVVEAAWRSGALSTAAYAEKLLKNVAAVPGLINSVASSGTNELIRNSKATLVSCADDILELVNPINPNLFQATDKTAELVLAAIPKTYYISVDKIIAKSALSDLTVMGCLPRLEMLYLIQTDGIGWKKL